MSALEGKADTPTDEPLEADVALQRRFIAPLKCPKVVVASRRSLLGRACLNHLDIEYRISAIPRHEGYGYRQQHQGNEDLSDHLGNFPQMHFVFWTSRRSFDVKDAEIVSSRVVYQPPQAYWQNNE